MKDHIDAVVFDDGRAETKLTIKETASHDEQKEKGTVTPDTSDHNDIMQWMLILVGSSVLSLILLIAAVRLRQTQ
ncbi:MAG: hypothetical protein E7194_09220 [Erysipelotrichaceae bacterium]|nr:hypothetical protein [Erysipelotrichaceae bacterium]